MPRNLKTVVAASALIGGLLAAPALYAHGTGGGGMVQGRQGDMMGQRGMMNMMQQMSQMMGQCNEMMQDMDDHGSAAKRTVAKSGPVAAAAEPARPPMTKA
jgi:hypothetical protein